MKTVIQVGLWRMCEYRFLAEREMPRTRFYPAGNLKFPLLPDDFDESGEWFYHGIDENLSCFPFRLEWYRSKTHEMRMTDEPGSTLADFCKSENITSIELLALDIEGWEYRVVPTFLDCPPIQYFIVEFHPFDVIKRNPHIDESLFNPISEQAFIQMVENMGFQLENKFGTHCGDVVEMWFKHKGS